jgi:WD40 repeat protein
MPSPPKPAPADGSPRGLRLRHTLTGHSDRVGRIAWSPDGRLLATPSLDRTVRLWDVSSGSSRALTGHTDAVISVAWSPDGHSLASGAKDGSVRLWDVEEGVCRAILRHGATAPAVAWSPGGRLVASGSAGLHIWNARNDTKIRSFEDPGVQVYALAWSPDQRLLACASRRVELWDAATWEPVRHLQGIWYCLAWSHRQSVLALCSQEILLWNAETGQQIRTLEGHTNFVLAIAFSADDRFLASKSADGTVRLWRCDTWETVAILAEPAGHEWSAGLAFHPTEPVLATLGDNDTIVRIWELEDHLLMESRPRTESAHYTTAKIALVGDSGVGKTNLGWSLAGHEFKDHGSTHGQQLWVLGALGSLRKDGASCEAILWDWAGQPDYRTVHSLFLDDVDLALLLFDACNRQNPLAGVEFWLQQLSRGGTPPPAILVAARSDRGTPSLSATALEEFCRRKGISGGWLSTSAMSGDGVAELMQRIGQQVPWEKLLSTDTTETFKRIKDSVLELRGKTSPGNVLMSRDTLLKHINAPGTNRKFSLEEVMAAVRNLANHGYVSVLPTSSKNSILLAPDLLINLASSFVLEARRHPRSLGVLEEDLLRRGEYRFPELAELLADEREGLLDAACVLFLQHNLCFRETLSDRTFLVFPSLINEQRPRLEEAGFDEDVSYRVTGAVENVYAALVVLLGYTNTFTRTDQWQNQAQYEVGEAEICGFRQIAGHEGEIELVLYYRTDTPQHVKWLFQGTFETFLRRREVAVVRTLPIICPDCGLRQDRGAVRRQLEDGRGFVFCPRDGTRIGLRRGEEISALSRVQPGDLEAARRRTAFAAALVWIKSLARPEQGESARPSCFISYCWGDAVEEKWVRTLAQDLLDSGVQINLDALLPPPANLVLSLQDLVMNSRFVLVVGTPRYVERSRSPGSSMVALELSLINLRFQRTIEKQGVIPLLLAGSQDSSLPPLLRVPAHFDFRDERNYFVVLFNLLLTLFAIPFDWPELDHLRDSMR